MAIQNLFTSRDNNANANTYVGQEDRLWYNINNNALYVSDGVTPGGVPVGLDPDSNITANVITVNTLTSTSGTISVTGNLAITGNIPAATNIRIGGVRAGPGANISNTGLLTIDSANVPFSFGNFFANNNILSIVNSDENMILATQGNAEIQLVGNIGFYKSNGLPPDPNNLFFFARDDGQLQILVPVEDPLEGGVEIIGSATGNFVTPGAPGTMLQLTGNPDLPCRVYHDSLREYSSYVARRYNGTTASPGQVLAGQDVFRINTTAATDAGMGNVAMAQVRFTALENQTTTAQGSEISFYVTAIGSPAANRVEVANITVADGITATKFTTAGIVTATGNITGGNILTAGLISVTGNITGGNISTGGIINATGNITAGNLAGTLITGTLTTAAQPNITSVGTLSSLTVTGNVSGGNLTTGAQVVATGNITGGNINTGAQVVAAGNITGSNINTGGQVSATGNITGANITATANIADSKGDVRSIPVNTQNTGYTLLATDAGKLINITAGNVTVPAGVFASPFGQAITIYNDQNSSNAVVQGSGVTIRLAGTAATGNRTLARYGLATVVCVSANTFVISGAGLT